MEKRITTVTRPIDQIVELDASYARIQDNPLIDVELLPHQAIIVQAMLDIEDKRYIPVDVPEVNSYAEGPIYAESSAMVLSEKFGSGKTFMILALITKSRVPKAFPDRLFIVKSTTTILKRFTAPDALIRSTLIAVGSSVLFQWIHAISVYTRLRVFVIANTHHFNQFKTRLLENKLESIDIVLVKNGFITASTETLAPFTYDKSQIHLLTAISLITQNKCWARVVYDDFDTIRMPLHIKTIDTLSTIYVSATKKSNRNSETKTLLDSTGKLKNYSRPLSETTDDTILFNVFNIRCSPEFVENSIAMTKFNAYQYICPHPDENYIRLLDRMSDEEANRFVEMLNANAVSTAASLLGIKSTSIADIFSHILDKKYQKYLYHRNVLDILHDIESTLDTLPSGTHTDEDIKVIVEKIKSHQRPTITRNSHNLETKINKLIKEFSSAADKYRQAIDRVIDNVKEGDCPICYIGLTEADGVFISRCCGVIICSNCAVRGSNIHYTKVNGINRLYGNCAKCRAKINPVNDWILVDRSINLEQLINARGDEIPEQPIDSESSSEIDAAQNIWHSKLKILYSIICNQPIGLRQSIPLNIPGLIQGTKDVPDDGRARKVIVFANYGETLETIAKFLTVHKIKHAILCGSAATRAKIVKQFKESGQVLLINSQTNCAGLHFAFVTDLVFFHKISDPNIEAQVAGRIQRIGRTHNANIHYITYQNEQKYIPV